MNKIIHPYTSWKQHALIDLRPQEINSIDPTLGGLWIWKTSRIDVFCHQTTGSMEDFGQTTEGFWFLKWTKSLIFFVRSILVLKVPGLIMIKGFRYHHIRLRGAIAPACRYTYWNRTWLFSWKTRAAKSVTTRLKNQQGKATLKRFRK